MLTEDNLKRLENSLKDVDKTLTWGENFDYSYECEPPNSDSDVDEPNEMLVQSPESSFEMNPPIVPTFKLHVPTSEIVSQIVTSSFAVKLSPASYLKRSSSDPLNLNQSNRMGRRSFERTATHSILESTEDLHPATFSQNLAKEASIRSLTVSFCFLFARHCFVFKYSSNSSEICVLVHRQIDSNYKFDLD
jgi:hypothetical protein